MRRRRRTQGDKEIEAYFKRVEISLRDVSWITLVDIFICLPLVVLASRKISNRDQRYLDVVTIS